MSEQVTRIEFDLPVLKGWACPNCGGVGRMPDGYASFGINTATGKGFCESREGSKCVVCNGKGRVNCTPVE